MKEKTAQKVRQRKVRTRALGMLSVEDVKIVKIAQGFMRRYRKDLDQLAEL